MHALSVLNMLGTVVVSPTMYHWMAIAIVLCPLLGFCMKVFYQMAGKKIMWTLTDKTCVFFMLIAFVLGTIITGGLLFPSEEQEANAETYINSRASVNWLVFGRNDAEKFIAFLDGQEKFHYGWAMDTVRRRERELEQVKNLRAELASLTHKIANLHSDAPGYQHEFNTLRDRRTNINERIDGMVASHAETAVLGERELFELRKCLDSLAERAAPEKFREEWGSVLLRAGHLKNALHGQWRATHERWEVNFGVEFTPMTVLMLFMVTMIATLIHIYSMGYMHGDPRYPRFFSYISLFAFGMLGLVVSDNLLMLYMFWEVMGLCSYLLIGFFFEKESAAAASLKAFMVTRVGDVGMFIGMMILFSMTGTFTWTDMYASVGLQYQEALAAGSVNVYAFGFPITIGTLMLFLGPMGKSAQFPLHVWLPDAMEGPTPVSAMIHAATMVSGGVLLCGKIFPMMTPLTMDIVALVGGFTAIFAASIALVQNDIKKVLAYSTISQLGFMICSIGVGAWVAAMWHLLTHAYFKACLFLGAGSVIHAVHTNDMREMGGLRKKMPITFITMAITTCAIAGVPFIFSGFFSKDAIIKGTLFMAMDESNAQIRKYLPFVMLWLAAGMTAFYMFRLLFMTFFGEPRDKHKYDHAHESPASMCLPLVVLAFFSISVWWIPALFTVGGKAYPTLDVENILITPKQEAVPAPYGAVFSPRELAPFHHHEGGHGDDHGSVFTERYLAQNEQGGDGHGHEGGHEEAADRHDEGAHKHSDAGKHDAAAHVEQHRGEIINGRQALQKHYDRDHKAHLYAMGLSILIATLGIGMAYLMYVANPGIPGKLVAAVPWAHRVLENKYYMDELYQVVFVKTLLRVNQGLSDFDKYVIDGLVNLTALIMRLLAFFHGLFDKYVIDGVVNMVGELVRDLGDGMRHAQTGKVQHYVIGIGVGVVFIALYMLAISSDIYQVEAFQKLWR